MRRGMYLLSLSLGVVAPACNWTDVESGDTDSNTDGGSGTTSASTSSTSEDTSTSTSTTGGSASGSGTTGGSGSSSDSASATGSTSDSATAGSTSDGTGTAGTSTTDGSGSTGGVECSDLGEDACNNTAGCFGISGRPLSSTQGPGPSKPCWDPPVFLECAPDMGCGDAITVACEGNNTTPHQFLDTCIPTGWTECNAPGGQIDTCP